uniref:hypothetical protein n=1 Tax=Escherichia coli TaxID=562 RepID=UPI00273A2DC4
MFNRVNLGNLLLDLSITSLNTDRIIGLITTAQNKKPQNIITFIIQLFHAYINTTLLPDYNQKDHANDLL